MLGSEGKFTFASAEAQLVSGRSGTGNQVFWFHAQSSFHVGQKSKEGSYLSTISDITKFQEFVCQAAAPGSRKEVLKGEIKGLKGNIYSYFSTTDRSLLTAASPSSLLSQLQKQQERLPYDMVAHSASVLCVPFGCAPACTEALRGRPGG